MALLEARSTGALVQSATDVVMGALAVRWHVRSYGFPTSDSGKLVTIRLFNSNFYATMSQHELSETEELEIEQSTDIPSIYRGGTVSLEPGTGGSAAEPPKHAKQTSIVCQTEYCHLSPEVRYLSTRIFIPQLHVYLGIALPRPEDTFGSPSLGDFVRGGSFAPVCACIILMLFILQEERLRYYLDEGLTSGPQFGPPMPAPAFSVSSRVKSTSSDSKSSYLGLGCPIPEELATGTCSRCAARLDAGVEGDEEAEATSEESESDRDTCNFFLRLLTTTFLILRVFP